MRLVRPFLPVKAGWFVAVFFCQFTHNAKFNTPLDYHILKCTFLCFRRHIRKFGVHISLNDTEISKLVNTILPLLECSLRWILRIPMLYGISKFKNKVAVFLLLSVPVVIPQQSR